MDRNVLYILRAKHSARTKQPLKNIYPKEHIGHSNCDSEVLRLVYWETANSLVARSLQPNKPVNVLNSFYILQSCFLKESALGNGLNFDCNFLLKAKVK